MLPGLKDYEVLPKGVDMPDKCQGFEIDQKFVDQSMSSPEKNSGTNDSDKSSAAKMKKTFGKFPIK